MKFELYLIDLRIPEWSDAYINYGLLKKLLSPFKIFSMLYIKTDFKDGRD